jgi:hypothetical protein
MKLLTRITVAELVTGLGKHGHNLQMYIHALMDAVDDAVCYQVREEDGDICVYYTTSAEQLIQAKRAELWIQLIDCLHNANRIQQQLFWQDTDPAVGLVLHGHLTQMTDVLTDWGSAEGYDVE